MRSTHSPMILATLPLFVLLGSGCGDALLSGPDIPAPEAQTVETGPAQVVIAIDQKEPLIPHLHRRTLGVGRSPHDRGPQRLDPRAHALRKCRRVLLGRRAHGAGG